jgi:hypothetical protein
VETPTKRGHGRRSLRGRRSCLLRRLFSQHLVGDTTERLGEREAPLLLGQDALQLADDRAIAFTAGRPPMLLRRGAGPQNPMLTIDRDKGEFHLARLKASSVPDAAKSLKDLLEARMPEVELVDVLIDLDNETGMMRW